MASSVQQIDSASHLPPVVLIKIASMLQRDGTIGHDGSFKDRLRLAAVSQQLREAVLSSIQQKRRRMMVIEVSVLGIKINDLRDTRISAYPKYCIDALQAFSQPNALMLKADQHAYLDHLYEFILPMFSPVSLTRLDVRLEICSLEVDSPFDKIMHGIGSMPNIAVLRISVANRYASTTAQFMNLPSVPTTGPFRHLLTLGTLRTLRIDARGLPAKAQADLLGNLVNRSPAIISHFCCADYESDGKLTLREHFAAMDGRARDHIVSVCCVDERHAQEDPCSFLVHLPNCRKVHYKGWYNVTRAKLDRFGALMLDVCGIDESHRGKTLEWHIGCRNDSHLQMYFQEGGEKQVEYARDGTVFRMLLGANAMMRQEHCSFSYSPGDYL